MISEETQEIHQNTREKMKKLFDSKVALKNLSEIDYSKEPNSYRIEKYIEQNKKETTITRELLDSQFTY